MKNERVITGFNRLAPMYAGLTSLVFGSSLKQAQEYFLSSVRQGDRVLILGGGSGDLLKSLMDKNPHMVVDYIDISPRMIQLAKAKSGSVSTINFIVGTEQDIPDQNYTTIITHFYLDLFSDDTLSQIIQSIKAHLGGNGQWLVADFVQEKRWHALMLWVMYRFFRAVTGIEARKLPDWNAALEKAGMQLIRSGKFYGGFIQSVVYKSNP